MGNLPEIKSILSYLILCYLINVSIIFFRVTENILATSRPITLYMEKHNILHQFKT